MTTSSSGLQEVAAINNEAFLKLTKIAFASVEKLTALNLNATRTALEESVASSGALLQSKDPKAQLATQGAVPAAAARNAQVYIHELQQITAEAQKEVAALVSSYLSSGKEAVPSSTDWIKGFGLFKAFAEQMNVLTDVSSKIVGDATARLEQAKTKS